MNQQLSHITHLHPMYDIHPEMFEPRRVPCNLGKLGDLGDFYLVNPTDEEIAEINAKEIAKSELMMIGIEPTPSVLSSYVQEKNTSMNLIIYVNENFEEEKALFDLEKNRVIMMGDHYHEKIDHKIEGYLQALKEFDIYDKDVEDEYIDESHKHYGVIGFEG